MPLRPSNPNSISGNFLNPFSDQTAEIESLFQLKILWSELILYFAYLLFWICGVTNNNRNLGANLANNDPRKLYPVPDFSSEMCTFF